MDISIVIVNWNTKEMLRGCLCSLYADSVRALQFEVIVVDNASGDDSVPMLQQEFPQVRLIRNQVNRGFAAANNQGLRIAAGRYALLLNSDTLVMPGTLSRVVAYADQNHDCAVIGCRVLLDERTVQRTCFQFPGPLNAFLEESGLARLFPRSRFFGRPWMGWWDRDGTNDVDVVSGMFMLVRREAIEAVGLMDEDYFVYGEEADWCFRFWRAGWRCRFAPVADIIHLDGGGKSTSQVSVKMFVQLQKSLLLFHRKNLGWPAWLCSKCLYTSSACCRAVWWGLLRLSGRGAQCQRKFEQSIAAMRFHLLGVTPQ